MTTNTTSNNSRGIGFCGLLGIVFITLKLTGYINWSWLWVLAPLWGPFAVVVGLFLLAFVGVAGLELIDKRSKR